jgi:hypothetical protein
MNKFIYKGGAFNRLQSVSRAVVAFFNRYGVYQAAPSQDYWGSIPVEMTEHITAAKTLTSFENGKHLLYASLASGAVTLPAANKGKMRFALSLHALVTSGVGAQFTPATGDKFIGSGLTGTANQVLRLAAAGDVLGDFAEIVSDGVDTWHIVKLKGIWTVV